MDYYFDKVVKVAPTTENGGAVSLTRRPVPQNSNGAAMMTGSFLEERVSGASLPMVRE